MSLPNRSVLIVDDEEATARLLERVVNTLGYQARSCRTVAEALIELASANYDLVLLDVYLPDGEGFEVLQRFRHYTAYTPFIVMTGAAELDLPIRALRMGAAGYILKPVTLDVLRAEFQRVIGKRRCTIDDLDRLATAQEQLEERTRALLKESGQAFAFQRSLVTALCRLAEFRDQETGEHLHRMAEYCRLIACALREHPKYRTVVDDLYIRRLLLAAPLHDIGKAGIPDAVLLKPGRLTPEEFDMMKTHTTIGHNILASVLEGVEEREAQVVRMGMNICIAHHERWDGTGYPRRLAGEEIPLCARIAAVADVYDALSSPRVYRAETFSHEQLIEMIERESGSHFDPDVVQAFRTVEKQIEAVRKDINHAKPLSSSPTPLPLMVG